MGVAGAGPDGVRWFITAGLPEREIKVMAAKGFRIVERAAYFLVWSGRRRRWLACTTTWM